MLAPVTTLHYPSASPSGLRGALAESYPSLRPGDSICVMGPTEVVFVYYRTRFDLSRQKVHIIKLPPGQEPAAAAAAAATAMSAPRVWVLVSSAIPDYQGVPQKFLAEMDRLGRRTEYHFSGDTYMVLYEK
jgi:hypothetical protein